MCIITHFSLSALAHPCFTPFPVSHRPSHISYGLSTPSVPFLTWPSTFSTRKLSTSSGKRPWPSWGAGGFPVTHYSLVPVILCWGSLRARVPGALPSVVHLAPEATECASHVWAGHLALAFFFFLSRQL